MQWLIILLFVDILNTNQYDYMKTVVESIQDWLNVNNHIVCSFECCLCKDNSITFPWLKDGPVSHVKADNKWGIDDWLLLGLPQILLGPDYLMANVMFHMVCYADPSGRFSIETKREIIR